MNNKILIKIIKLTYVNKKIRYDYIAKINYNLLSSKIFFNFKIIYF